MLRSATHVFPTEIMMKGKFYFIGRILQLLEVHRDITDTWVELKCLFQVIDSNHLLFFACYSWVSVVKELRNCLVQASLDLEEI